MHLTVDDCLDLYSRLAQKVFGNERTSLRGLLRAKFDAETLKNVILETLREKKFDEDSNMMDDSNIGCKT
jgi:hypothetical protein